MRISSKGRYGLASMIILASQQKSVEFSTILSISEKLGISKIYLEQVFALLKRAELVTSTKGAQGGYQLAKLPEEISVYEILKAVEVSLFENTESSVKEKAESVEDTMQQLVFAKLDEKISDTLSSIKLSTLASESKKNLFSKTNMFYI